MCKRKFSIRCLVMLMLIYSSASSQSITQRLSTAVQQFESDPQMRHAIISIYVADAITGKKVYAHNEQVGLAPASTQKIFTSAAAFEILGKDYSYKTELGYNGTITEGALNGWLYVTGSGDPTFGSWRWKETHDTVILKKWLQAINNAGISKKISGGIGSVNTKFTHQGIPGGWIWEDIGNYYGAGSYVINWRENQYDLLLRSGSKIGDSVAIAETKPVHLLSNAYINELKTAAKGTGDNAYIFFGLGADRSTLLRGTIPAGEKRFSISGASPDPVKDFISALESKLAGEKIDISISCVDTEQWLSHNNEKRGAISVITTHRSPPLDSINYYFMRRSINLYGEALVKTLALEKNQPVDTENGIEILRDFWSARGIEKPAIHIIDGSGLSPQNRVTTDAEVKVLQFARSRPWFQSFYHSLPEYNGMKMKSGSIGGARAYAGYHKAKNGKEYTFSIIVNNYDGPAGEIVKKMYRVLDILK